MCMSLRVNVEKPKVMVGRVIVKDRLFMVKVAS